MRLPSNDREVLLSQERVTLFQDDSCVRVEKVVTNGATKKGLRDQRVLPGETGVGVELFLELAAPVRAPELTVECVLLSCLRRKNIFVPFDSASRDLRVHLYERAHAATVTEES